MNALERCQSMSSDEVISDTANWQSWLDVEAALARAQARIGMIPDWAAARITENAQLDRIGVDPLRASIRETMAPVVSITRLLAEKSGDAGNYVHWGATTQNVMQTGRLLLMRKSWRSVQSHLSRIFEQLADLVQAHENTLTVARTNRRHALPVTFGFKVAGWVDELQRATERMQDMEPRVFRLPFGGAVGAMHTWEGRGEALSRALADELELGELLVPGRTVNDLFVDYIVSFSMLGMTIERIARELYLLMDEDIGELSERLDSQVVGSSTMPHKVNPKRVVKVIPLCARLRGYAASAMEAGLPSHEGDAAANGLLASVMNDTCRDSLLMVDRFSALLDCLTVHKDTMYSNLARTGTLLSSENLMMELARHIGHGRAHDVLHDIIAHADTTDLASSVHDHPAIVGLENAIDIEALLDFEQYTGESTRIARESVRLSRRMANALADAIR